LVILTTITQPLAAFERDPAGYERILLPVIFNIPIPGLHGSQWETALWVRNTSGFPAHVFQSECTFFCTCAMIECYPESNVSRPGLTYRSSIASDFHRHNPGAFMYVNRTAAPDVAIQLRAREISRDPTWWGLEIPVVREHDWYTRTLHLLGIPTHERFRQILRVYGDRAGSALVLVRIHPNSGDEVLFERVVELTKGGGFPELQPDWPSYPLYGVVPYLSPLLPAPLPGTIRVTIEPLTPGLRFWAFVSITHNETQQVTTVTPQ
jgi:hypothetical protein